MNRLLEKLDRLARAETLLDEKRLTPAIARSHSIQVNQEGIARTARDLLGHPEVDMVRLANIWPELAEIASDVGEQIEIEVRYAPYLKRQSADIAAFKREENLCLPQDVVFASVGGLSRELGALLDRVKPTTLGAAARLPGMTPAALTRLYRYVKNAA